MNFQYSCEIANNSIQIISSRYTFYTLYYFFTRDKWACSPHPNPDFRFYHPFNKRCDIYNTHRRTYRITLAYVYTCMCITRSPHRSSPRHCTATVYLTVPNVLSKALISHWNAVTKWQLARGILYAPRTCIGTHIEARVRVLAPTRLSSPLSFYFSLSPIPLFVTFVLYTLCPRFDSFDSFAMERENAATRSAVREKPLTNDVKVRSAGRICDRQKFFPVMMYARIPDVLRKRVHGLSTFLLRATNLPPTKIAANPLRDSDKIISFSLAN